MYLMNLSPRLSEWTRECQIITFMIEIYFRALDKVFNLTSI